MHKDQILSVLVGLAGAVNNNGKTADTDRIVLQALSYCDCKDDISQSDAEAILTTLRQEKHAVSPGCAVCNAPCGNTSDYDMELFYRCSPSVLELKEKIWKITEHLAADLMASDCFDAPEIIYKAIAWLGYNLDEELYQELLGQMNQFLPKNS